MSWLGRLTGQQEEIDFLRSELREANRLISNLISDPPPSQHEVQQLQQRDKPLPVNPRQSWGLRKQRLEEQERKRSVQKQVNQTEKYWSEKSEKSAV